MHRGAQEATLQSIQLELATHEKHSFASTISGGIISQVAFHTHPNQTALPCTNAYNEQSYLSIVCSTILSNNQHTYMYLCEPFVASLFQAASVHQRHIQSMTYTKRVKTDAYLTVVISISRVQCDVDTKKCVKC